MSRKHILHDSIVIYLFVGTAIPLLFYFFDAGIPSLNIDKYKNGIIGFVILYVYGLFFGAFLSIPAALLNYVLSKYSFKNGWQNKFFATKRKTVLYALLNGIIIATTFYIIFLVFTKIIVFGMPAVAFLYAPCIVSSIVFCLYRRKNT
jgi:hypothetical protein